MKRIGTLIYSTQGAGILQAASRLTHEYVKSMGRSRHEAS